MPLDALGFTRAALIISVSPPPCGPCPQRLGNGTFILMAIVQRKTVATAGRSYGGPSEKFVGVLGGIFRSCPRTSQKLPFCGNHQTERILGQLLRSLLQNPRNLSEVAPEVRPAVHTALFCLNGDRLL